MSKIIDYSRRSNDEGGESELKAQLETGSSLRFLIGVIGFIVLICAPAIIKGIYSWLW